MSRWGLFNRCYRLSADAHADRRPGDGLETVPIWWAAPLDRLADPGDFWAYFPTNTASLVAGIVNAPWKTNEDRQNLLPGPYNDELIEAAAEMIAEELPTLATKDDPARHLDALPRRNETGDAEQVRLLRTHLFSASRERNIVPDQNGKLYGIRDISYPPKRLTDGSDRGPLERWAAYLGRPSNWLHHMAFTRNRLARIDQLFPPARMWSQYRGFYDSEPTAPRATIAEWLEALVSRRC